MNIQSILSNPIEIPASTRRALLGFLILVHLCLTIPSILTNSVTIDEFTHVPVGYVQIQYGLFQFEPANPPLIRMIFGYPIGYYSPKLYWGTQLDSMDYVVYGYYFQDQNIHLYHLMVMTSRFIVLLISIVLAYLVYRWTREEYGTLAGFLSLILCLFNPNMLAHGTLATLDMGLSLTWVIVLYSLVKYLDEPNWIRAVIAGISLGFAQCAKFTSLLLYILIPMFIFLDPSMRNRFLQKKVFLQQIMIILLSLVVINGIYGFNRSFTPLGEYQFQTPPLKKIQSALPSSLSVPLPYYYLVGLDQQLSQTRNFLNYLNGEFSTRGYWYYYLEAFLIKNPIPLMIILLWSLVLFIRHRDSLTRSEQVWILTSLFLFLFFSFSRVKNIGLRYILPVFPFVFMICGRVITPNLNRKHVVGLALLVVWYIGTCVYICPQYIGFYNLAVGGPQNGYKYLLDSNTDWGQDLIRLKGYMNQHNLNKIFFSSTGPVYPRTYGINSDPVPTSPTHGIIAISANQLYGIDAPEPSQRDRYAWLKKYQPSDRIGYSIFLYDISTTAKL